MYVQQNALLQSLTKYGESGSISDFEALRPRLDAHFETSKSVKIPIATAVNVARHFLAIIERNDDKVRRVQAWKGLLVMCDRENNSTAFDLLNELQSMDVLSFVPRAISTLASDQSDLEAESCLSFLTMFARADEARQIMIGETPGIIETLVAMMDTEFNRSTDILKIALCQALANVLGRNSKTSRTNTEQFVAADGFRVMNDILRHLNQWARDLQTACPMTADEITVVQSFLLSLNSMYGSLIYVDFRDAPAVPREKYMYNMVSLAVTTATLHSYFNLSNNPVFKDAALGAFVNYVEFVNSYSPEALEATLLYAGNTATPPALRVPFIVQFQRISRDPQLRHKQEVVMQVVLGYSSMFEAVAIVAYEDMQGHSAGCVPDYGLNAEVCAYPGCHLNSLCCGELKKCARCKAVSYCGKEHQTMDWKQHKKTCVPSQTSLQHVN